MSSTWPNPTHLGWVEFFWPTMVGYVKKSPQLDPTRPMHTLNLLWFWKFEVDFGWRVWCCNIWSWFFFGCLTWIGWSRSNGGLVVADLRWVVAFVVDSVRERWSEREKVGERGQTKSFFLTLAMKSISPQSRVVLFISSFFGLFWGDWCVIKLWVFDFFFNIKLVWLAWCECS